MAFTELAPERHAFISDLAEDVWLTHSGERQVYLDGIVNAVDASLSYGNYGEAFDGLLEYRTPTFHIYCNESRGQTAGTSRARFTVAHELGHFFIDEHRNALMAGKPAHSSFPEQAAENVVEVEANLFAANLLMVAQEFRKALLDVHPGVGGIIDLSSTFRVSAQSAALRFTAISGRPCAIVMFRENGKPWWDVSRELKLQGHQRIQKLNSEMIPHDSATGMALRDSSSGLGPVRQTGTIASAWFAPAFNGKNQERVFMESSVRLASRGVLTLIEPCDVCK